MIKYLIIALLILFPLKAYADTTLVEDTFTDTHLTNLDAHTPTPTGTSWTREVLADECSGRIMRVVDPGRVENNSSDNCGMFYYASPSSGQAEYYTQATFVDAGSIASGAAATLIGRYADNGNLYVVYSNDDNGQPYTLAKRVSGSNSSLGTGGAFSNGNSDVIKLELKDATKKVFENSTEVISSTDNALTSAGKAGIGCGGTETTTTLDCSAQAEHDNFFLVEISAITPRRVMIISFLNWLIAPAKAQERVRDGTWYISPVIKENNLRRPKIETVTDPGQPLLFNEDTGRFDIPQFCHTSNVIRDTDIPNEWALSYVRCADYSALDADPEIIKVYNETDGVDLRLNQLSSTDRNSLRTKVNTRKTRNSALTNSDTVRKWIEDLGKEINPQFNVDGTYVR
jgi:hypothetical protein